MTNAYTESTFWEAIKQPTIKVKPAKAIEIDGLSKQIIEKILNKEIQGLTIRRGQLCYAFNPFKPMPQELRKAYPQELTEYLDSKLSKDEEGFLS